jgi:hypothetical protein
VSGVRDQPQGAFRYLTFGCRQTWVEVFLANEGHLPEGLGPRQLTALHNYLHDAGLLRNGASGLTPTGRLLQLALHSHSTATWQVIWANWTQHSALFSWWATLPCGQYSRDQCLASLSQTLCNSAERSIRDALSALVATLRHTPIADVLGQGTVVDSGRTWRILKTGPRQPISWWAIYTLALVCPTTMLMYPNNKGSTNAVAQVLGVSDSVLAAALESLWQPDLCTVSRDVAGSIRINLIPGVTPERILRRWIAKE